MCNSESDPMTLHHKLPLTLTLNTYSLDDEGSRGICLTGDMLPAHSEVFARCFATAKYMHTHVPADVQWDGFTAWEHNIDTELVPQTDEQAALVFLLRSVFAGDLRAAEVRPCIESMFASHARARARANGANAEVFADMEGMRLHYASEVRAGANVLATGVCELYKVHLQRQISETDATHGIRFVTEHDPALLRCYVQTPLFGRKWLRPALHSGKCVSCVRAVQVSALPAASAKVPSSCLRSVRFEDVSTFYGNLVTMWVAKSPTGAVLHAFSLEAFTSACLSFGENIEWQRLVDAIHQHPVGAVYLPKRYGQNVVVASGKAWQVAQVSLGTAPRLPSVAGVVTMKVRRHRNLENAEHTWVFGKVTSLASVHRLCFHVQREDGKAETRCMLSPRALVDYASAAVKNGGLVEDFGGMLQVFKGASGSDVLWHVKVFVPEQTGAINFVDLS